MFFFCVEGHTSDIDSTEIFALFIIAVVQCSETPSFLAVGALTRNRLSFWNTIAHAARRSNVNLWVSLFLRIIVKSYFTFFFFSVITRRKEIFFVPRWRKNAFFSSSLLCATTRVIAIWREVFFYLPKKLRRCLVREWKRLLADDISRLVCPQRDEMYFDPSPSATSRFDRLTFFSSLLLRELILCLSWAEILSSTITPFSWGNVVYFFLFSFLPRFASANETSWNFSEKVTQPVCTRPCTTNAFKKFIFTQKGSPSKGNLFIFPATKKGEKKSTSLFHLF